MSAESKQFTTNGVNKDRFKSLIAKSIGRHANYPHPLSVATIERYLNGGLPLTFISDGTSYRLLRNIKHPDFLIPGERQIRGVWSIVSNADEENRLHCELESSIDTNRKIVWEANLFLLGEDRFLTQIFEDIKSSL